MAHTMLLVSISAVFLLVQVVNCQIDEPSQYAATAVPKNPSSVRQALGYNKYDGHNVKDTDKSVVYGNNWEQFDNINDANQGQNQYFGNQAQQPYRYYRSIYYR